MMKSNYTSRYRAVLLPIGVIGRQSQQGSGICCSGDWLQANGIQCNIGRRRGSLYAAFVLLAAGTPNDWNSDTVGSSIHHSIADDHIGIKKFIQHAAWICSDFLLRDASCDDGRRVAAESEHCKLDGFRSRCPTFAQRSPPLVTNQQL